MKLGVISEARMRVGRPIARTIFRSPSLRKRLVARRRTDIERGLDEDTALMLALDDTMGESHFWEMTPQAARRKMREAIHMVDDPPAEHVETRSLVLCGDLPARAYVPSSLHGPSPALYFVHGGGWVMGDLDTHDSL